MLKADHVQVQHGAQFWRDLYIGTSVIDKDPWIHEIRLPLGFARSKGRNQAAWRDQAYPRTRQPDAFAIPEAEETTREIRIVEDGIEPASCPIARIVVSRRPEHRGAEADPVAIPR
jgi:hypothetical protein